MFRAILAIFTVITCGLAAPGTVLAKDSTTKSAQTEATKFDRQALIEEYNAMRKQSYAMPDDYDFVRLRELFKLQPDYRPYFLNPIVKFRPIYSEYKNDPEQAKPLIKEYIEKNFALGQAHSRLMSHYKSADQNAEKEKYHAWMARGLIIAFRDSGDGKSAETAMEPLIIGEEYLAARQVIENKPKQSLENIDGRMYDVLKGKHKETGEDVELWFHVTHIFGSKID